MTEDFRRGTSITFEVSNKPYVDRTVPFELNEYRNATYAWITITDPCGNIFVDCPMRPCSDRIGWYLYRLQTDNEYPLGQYRADVSLTNLVPESQSFCTSGTSGSSGTSGTGSFGTSGTSGTSGSSGMPHGDYTAVSKSSRYFRLIGDNI